MEKFNTAEAPKEAGRTPSWVGRVRASKDEEAMRLVSGIDTSQILEDQRWAESGLVGYLPVELPKWRGFPNEKDLDMALAYLEYVLASITNRTTPVIMDGDDWEKQLPIACGGILIPTHLELFLSVWARDPDPHRFATGIKLSKMVDKYYFAWMQMINEWLHSYRNQPWSAAISGNWWRKPGIFHRAVPDIENRGLGTHGRWTKFADVANCDLQTTFSTGRNPGIQTIETFYAIGPLFETNFSRMVQDNLFSGENVPDICPFSGRIMTTGEWLIDQRTFEWGLIRECPIPELANRNYSWDEEMPYFVTLENHECVTMPSIVLCENGKYDPLPFYGG